MAKALCVPIALDAFCLTPDIANVAKPDDLTFPTRLAPITQPNYTGLRIDSQLLQHDVLDPIDLHSTRPASLNPRITDLGQPDHPIRQNRIGVYLHWSLPLTYRGGSSKAKGADGYQNNASVDSSQPVFREVPNRWLIVRRLNHQSPQVLEEFESWIVESDRVWKIDDIDDVDNQRPNPSSKTVPDLEVDVSPFIALDAGGINDPRAIQTQAEVFLGRKVSSSGWREPEGKTPSGQQRTKLTVMSSSNPYLADYTAHNSNVFSICDTFVYGDSNNPQYLQNATASYCVVGWHQAESADPVFNPDDSTTPLQEMLKNLKIQLAANDQLGTLAKPLGQGQARLICHGTIRGVEWDREKRPKMSQGDILGKFFRNGTNFEPVSVGESPLDSFLAFIKAHTAGFDVQDVKILAAEGGDSADLALDVSHLAKDINLIAGLLLAADDSYDSQIKAQDILTTSNFQASDGGTEWHYKVKVKGSGENVTMPDATVVAKLDLYNQQQYLLDTITSALASARWDIWAEWWNLVSEVSEATNSSNGGKSQSDILQLTRNRVLGKYNLAMNLQQKQNTLNTTLTEMWNADSTDPTNPADTSLYQPSSKEQFYQRKDPTISLVGFDNPWDMIAMQTSGSMADGSKNALSRALDGTKSPSNLPFALDFLQTTTDTKKYLENVVGNLIEEFVSDSALPLDTRSNAVAVSGSGVADPLKPWYKDWMPQKAASSDGTASTDVPSPWNNLGQPFFPLFVELEMTYYHIPFNKWSLETLHAGNLSLQTIRYVVKDDLAQGDNMADVRTIAGRIPVLPHEAFSITSMISKLLQTNLQDVKTRFDDSDPDTNLDDIVMKDENQNLVVNKDNVDKLKYLSLPLTGLSTHLTTRVAGTHVKPNAREQGMQVKAVREAWIATQIDPQKPPIFATLLTEGNGKPVRAISGGSLRTDKSGNLIAADGSPILDAAGNVVAGTPGTLYIDPGNQQVYKEIVTAMDAETALTPYGNLQDFSASICEQCRLNVANCNEKRPTCGTCQTTNLSCRYTEHAPFKAVTHGQVMITKLNIVDKFGQVIPALVPEPRKKKDTAFPKALFPCMSEYLTPRGLQDDVPNPVFLDHTAEGIENRFIALTPAINQDVRLNGDFVVDSGQGYWRKVEDWEQPIFGWLVINYADYGLQFFLPDGTFFSEIRIGGPGGTARSHNWLPFQDPTVGNPQEGALANNPQLTQLLNWLTSGNASNASSTASDNLYAFFDMINQSIDTMSYAPTDYSDYMSSIVGKPLALANIGYSLELKEKPLVPQNTLIPPSIANRDPNDPDPAEHWITDGERLDQYAFPVKIGDVQRAFDGVVGYFDMTESDMPVSTPQPKPSGWYNISNPNCKITGSTLDSNMLLHTYFVDPKVEDKRRMIGIGHPHDPDSNAYPTVTPYYIDPLAAIDSKSNHRIEHFKRYHVKAVIMDPFTSVHLFTPILPIKSIQLPSWAVQMACRKMTAFFHLGPMLLTKEVPSYATLNALNMLAVADVNGGAGPNTATAPVDPTATAQPATPPQPSIALPMSTKNKWRWLQPYDMDYEHKRKMELDKARGTPDATVQGQVAQSTTKFGSLPLSEDDGKIKLPPGPYVATEGYLQLLEGIVKSAA